VAGFFVCADDRSEANLVTLATGGSWPVVPVRVHARKLTVAAIA